MRRKGTNLSFQESEIPHQSKFQLGLSSLQVLLLLLVYLKIHPHSNQLKTRSENQYNFLKLPIKYQQRRTRILKAAAVVLKNLKLMYSNYQKPSLKGKEVTSQNKSLKENMQLLNLIKLNLQSRMDLWIPRSLEIHTTEYLLDKLTKAQR